MTEKKVTKKSIDINKSKRAWIRNSNSNSNSYVDAEFSAYGTDATYSDACLYMHDGSDVTCTSFNTLAEVDKVINALETLKGWMEKYGKITK